jgi:hypothetical protein
MAKKVESDLEKVVVELYDHFSGLGAEKMWAKPVGEDLFEI